MKNNVMATGVLLFVFSFPAQAESVYVSERLSASILADQIPGSAVVGRAKTGTSLDVLEQGDSFTRVRTQDGVEGWIANSYLTRNKPAAMQVLAAQTRLKAVQAENNQLAKQVKTLESKLKQAQAAAAAVPEPAPAPAAPESAPQANGGDQIGIPVLLGFAISFAMLIAGFIIGVVWLRERTRRKLGGMHIRVN